MSDATVNTAGNPLGVKRFHHLEFYVGNAKQAAYFYRKAFGFSQLAYSGLETGDREKARYVLGQGRIRFVLTTPLNETAAINDQLRRHGDGVKDVAFEVKDATAAFKEAVKRGAEPAVDPHVVKDARGAVCRSAIKIYGDTIHSFVSNVDYQGPFLPGYEPLERPEPDAGLLAVDHVVANVEEGNMSRWADFYNQVFGFHKYITFDDKDISTEYSALQSTVMSDEHYVVKLPINEPAKGKRKSQIEEYIDFYNTPGVQHVAMLTRDIVPTVRRLIESGVDFLTVPDTYYDSLADRVGRIDESFDAIRPLGILVDRDDKGYLLQLFTRPVEDRPTFFFEIIQRKGARGFGKGNFKALFESIERDQARRGTL